MLTNISWKTPCRTGGTNVKTTQHVRKTYMRMRAHTHTHTKARVQAHRRARAWKWTEKHLPCLENSIYCAVLIARLAPLYKLHFLIWTAQYWKRLGIRKTKKESVLSSFVIHRALVFSKWDKTSKNLYLFICVSDQVLYGKLSFY